MRLYEFVIDEGARYTPEEIKTVLELLAQKIPYNEITNRTGIPTRKISNILSKHGPKKDTFVTSNAGKTRFKPEDIALIRKLHDDGVLYNDMVAQSGLTRNEVKAILNDYKDKKIRNPYYSPEQIEMAKRLFDQEYTKPNIARLMNLDLEDVIGIIKRHHTDREKRAKPRYTPKQINSVKELYDQGLSNGKIAEQTKLGYQQVADILTNYYSDRVRRKPRKSK